MFVLISLKQRIKLSSSHLRAFVDFIGSLSHLPAGCARGQPQQRLTAVLEVGVQAGNVLPGGVDVAEVEFQFVAFVDGVGARRIEQHVYGPHRLTHGVGDGQPCLQDLGTRVGDPLAGPIPHGAHRI